MLDLYELCLINMFFCVVGRIRLRGTPVAVQVMAKIVEAAQDTKSILNRATFATTSPQAKTDRFGEWRISAGYRGPVFCGEKR
jgi:hypothetical protein